MGALGTPLPVQILSFSFSFQDIICWRAYPVLCLGNPVSATVIAMQTEADPDFPLGGGANPPVGPSYDKFFSSRSHIKVKVTSRSKQKYLCPFKLYVKFYLF